MTLPLEQKKQEARLWFTSLRDAICACYETIEQEASSSSSSCSSARFKRTLWDRPQGGGGEISLLHGQVFEKVGVNISTVWGEFSPEFASRIPGTETSRQFFATGISLVAHMCSPFIPAIHMNTRFIVTEKAWFGGGADLTPTFVNAHDSTDFHAALKAACDRHNPDYYPEFKAWCDRYFYLPHRNEPRGIGGIFYDYLDSGQWQDDFAFTKDVGTTFLDIHPKLIRRHLHTPWNDSEKHQQLLKRGRYVEFNLLHDRGTKFGLMTGGNIEAILMSLPPQAAW